MIGGNLRFILSNLRIDANEAQILVIRDGDEVGLTINGPLDGNSWRGWGKGR